MQARLKPLQAAVATWATSAGSLAASANDLAASFKDQALCISGQIAPAALDGRQHQGLGERLGRGLGLGVCHRRSLALLRGALRAQSAPGPRVRCAGDEPAV
ncbi:MAG: hypothetical protein IPI49_33200 [Myxococcales bacterium]|nr:hypothetical protein [Myxococcales bacterium]